jgi:hypothetical protein
MSFLRIKTVKGKQYLYRQTSVRKGRKVKSVMEYLGALGWIAASTVSPGHPGGYSGHKSTDKRAIKDQDATDRERFRKEMENPKERFQREKARADEIRAGQTKAPDAKFLSDVADMKAFGESVKTPDKSSG